MTTFYVVRHGQSAANAAQIMQGALIDTPLTSLGKSQARKTFDKIKQQDFTHVFASPLKRAAQTAQILAPQMTTTYDWRLREFDYGNWNGQKLPQLWHDYAQYFDDAHNLLPGSQKISHGETNVAAQKRLSSFLADTWVKYPTEKVLLVSHGYAIKIILSLLLLNKDVSELSEPNNAGITKFKWTSQTRKLIYFNK